MLLLSQLNIRTVHKRKPHSLMTLTSSEIILEPVKPKPNQQLTQKQGTFTFHLNNRLAGQNLTVYFDGVKLKHLQYLGVTFDRCHQIAWFFIETDKRTSLVTFKQCFSPKLFYIFVWLIIHFYKARSHILTDYVYLNESSLSQTSGVISKNRVYFKLTLTPKTHCLNSGTHVSMFEQVSMVYGYTFHLFYK